MRKNLRSKLLAVCMVTIATITFAGCEGAEPTKEFSQPVKSSSISASISADQPRVIDNQGKLIYKLDEVAYSKIIKTAIPTQYTTGTGHAVYLDTDEKQFIISGHEQVYLTDGAIPTNALATLRTEKTAIRLFVQEDEAAVEKYEAAREQAEGLLSSPNKADQLTIIVNNLVMTDSADKASIEDNAVYVSAEALLSSVDNIRLIQVEGDNLDFTITNPNTSDKLQYIIYENNPSAITSANLSESLSANSPLVIFVEGKAFIDVEGMASVFDWQVTRTDNVVSIVTDPMLADGKAITVKDCQIPIEEKAGEQQGQAQGQQQQEASKPVVKPTTPPVAQPTPPKTTPPTTDKTPSQPNPGAGTGTTGGSGGSGGSGGMTAEDKAFMDAWDAEYGGGGRDPKDDGNWG